MQRRNQQLFRCDEKRPMWNFAEQKMTKIVSLEVSRTQRKVIFGHNPHNCYKTQLWIDRMGLILTIKLLANVRSAHSRFGRTSQHQLFRINISTFICRQCDKLRKLKTTLSLFHTQSSIRCSLALTHFCFAYFRHNLVKQICFLPVSPSHTHFLSLSLSFPFHFLCPKRKLVYA